jgi:hypothetical protein
MVARDILPSVSLEKRRPRAASYTQAVDSLRRVCITESEYLEVGVISEKLNQLMEISVQMEIDGIPKGGTVPLSHDTFLSRRCAVDYCAKDCHLRVIPKHRLKEADLQAAQNGSLHDSKEQSYQWKQSKSSGEYSDRICI